MARTLADALAGQLQNATGPSAAGAGQTEGLAGLLAARGGKAAPASGTTPRMSTLQESSAQGQVADTARQQSAAGVAAGAGIQAASSAQAAATDAKLDDVEQARLTQKQQFADRAASLLQEFKQGQATLDLDRDKDKAEQLGFYTRLNSDKYVTELEMVAAESRLEDALAFDEALMRDIWGEERGLLEQKLKFADLLNMDENKFRAEMGAMDLDFAVQLAGTAAAQANTAAQYKAGGDLISSGIQGYTEYDKQQKADAKK